MRERFTDVEVEGRRWRVGLVPADAGVWIFMQIQSDPKMSDYSIYTKIKDFVFSNVAVYVTENGVDIPKAIYAKGRWLAPELEMEQSPALVNELFFQALTYNMRPFVEKT